MPQLRRSAHIILALVLSFFAVAPHQHEGLNEALSRDAIERVGSCNEEVAHHFHAAKTTHAQPCVACARQHSGGAFRTVASGVIHPIVAWTIAVSSPSTTAAALVVTRLRGPPA